MKKMLEKNLKNSTKRNQNELLNMKFKYNFLEKRLWRIEDDYLYEISEENRQTEYYFTDIRISFKLGENKWILFNRQPKRMTVHYNQGSTHYEKELTLDLAKIETIFEFTDQDLINHEK